MLQVRRFVLSCSALLLLATATLWAQQTLNIDGVNLGPSRLPLRQVGARITISGSNIVVEPGSTALTTLGTITTGVWNAGAVTSNGILTGTSSFNLAGTANLSSATIVGGTLNVAGISTLNSNVRVGANVNPLVNYTSNLGALNLKYLTLHAAELWVETLVAQNTIATIGGRVLVGPTTPLVTDLTPGATTIRVKHNQMQNGHRVYMEADSKLEWFAVISSATGCGTDCFQYSVTRNLDGTGANEWYAGDAVFNTGTTGNGFIDLYSVSGVLGSGLGPTIVGNVRTGLTYNNIAPRWAIGNLANIYGYGAADVYGAAFGDNNGAWIKIDDVNGVRLGRAGVANIIITPAGAATFSGALSAATGTFAGSLTAATGTFSGELSAATGTFAGSLSAATGTFAGSLSAATGTFSGTLTAGQVTIDPTNGIKITPYASDLFYNPSAYAWVVPDGELGLTGINTTTVRKVYLHSFRTSAGFTEVLLQTSANTGTNHFAQIRLSSHTTDGANIFINAPGAGNITMSAGGTMTFTGDMVQGGSSTFTGVSGSFSSNLTVGATSGSLFAPTTAAVGGNWPFACFNPTTGQLTYGDAGVGCNTSDMRLKENVTPWTGGLTEVMKLAPVTYDWKDRGIKRTIGRQSGREVGLIAQDVAKVLPMVGVAPTTPDGYWNYNDRALTATLINAIQELKRDLDIVRAELVTLKSVREQR